MLPTTPLGFLPKASVSLLWLSYNPVQPVESHLERRRAPPSNCHCPAKKYVGIYPTSPSGAVCDKVNFVKQSKVKKVKLATIVEGNPKAPFSIATTPRCRGGRYSFPGWLYFTLDPHLIMLSVKQGGIKYHFLSLWYDSTWDWTQVSRAIGEHSNH